MPRISLPSFYAFKAKKETERQNSFSKKSATINQKRKIEDKEVTIQVGVMNEHFKVKRGETIPLKISSTASAHTILAAATKKHGDLNRRVENDNGRNYMLVFKDGGDIEFIPGTDPPEPFTLQRYKEVSGFGYSRIYLYLVPIFDEAEPDRLSISDSEDEKDELPAVTWLIKNATSQSKILNLYINTSHFLLKFHFHSNMYIWLICI